MATPYVTAIEVSPPQDLAIPHEQPIQPAQSASVPIFCLPFDILYQIFIILHAEDPSRSRFVVSHVCQQWRAAALDCSMLWTAIAFERGPPRWDKQEELVRRSANAGLEISLRDAAFKTSSIKTLKRTMKLLLPHVSRWKSLVISGIPPKIFRIFIDAIRHTTFPMLRTVEITRVRMGGRWKDPSLSWSMPALRNLLLYLSPFTPSSPICNNLRILHFWAETTQGTSAHATAQSWRDVLARSPELLSLEIRYFTFPDSDQAFKPDPQLNLLHHNLRHLDVGQSVSERLFALVHMPYLDTWKSSEWGRGTFASFQAMSAMSKWPSPCRITSLEVDGRDYREEISSLRRALRVFPLLQKLRFDWVDFGGQWWPTDIITLCPQLVSLRFEHCSGVTGREILNTVQSKSEDDEGATPIALIEIHGHPQLINVDEAVERGLRAIVELRLQEEAAKEHGCWFCVNTRLNVV